MYALTSNVVDWVFVITMVVVVVGALVRNEVRYRKDQRATMHTTMEDYRYSREQAQHGRTTNR